MNNKCVIGEYPIQVINTPIFAHRVNLKGAGLKMVFPPEGFPAVGFHWVVLTHAPHPNAAKLFMDFIHGEAAQKGSLGFGEAVTRLGVKSEYPVYPKPIYDLKGVVEMDWRKISDEDRLKAREEFRRIVIEKK